MKVSTGYLESAKRVSTIMVESQGLQRALVSSHGDECPHDLLMEVDNAVILRNFVFFGSGQRNRSRHCRCDLIFENEFGSFYNAVNSSRWKIWPFCVAFFVGDRRKN